MNRRTTGRRALTRVACGTFCTTREEHFLKHLDNSKKTFLRLVEKARSFPTKEADAFIADRNYQDLDQLVLEHLMGR